MGRRHEGAFAVRAAAVVLVAALCAGSGLAAPAPPAAGLAASEDVCDTAPVRGHHFDRYGGWTGLQRPATGRFTVGEVDGRWWLFTPLGNAYFANGPTGIDPFGDVIAASGVSPYHEHVLATHGSHEAWAAATLPRLCALGTRALGGWNTLVGIDLFAGQMAYTINIDVYAAMPEVAGGPAGRKVRRDVFVADAAARATAKAATPAVARCAADPWCIGVFVENEAPYAPAALQGGSHLDTYLSQPAGSPGKTAAQAFFEARYGGDLAAFNATWGTSLGGWDDLQGESSLGDCPTDIGYLDDLCVISSGEARRGDVYAFEAEVAGRVATLADEALAAVEPAMLNLGPRLVVDPYVPEVLAAISAPADVVSVNNYDISDTVAALLTPEVEAQLASVGALDYDPFVRLGQIHDITAKPVMVSEWFYRVARDVPTFPPFLPERPDPAARAAAAGTYLERILAMPFVVGETWFQWQDQPVEGRGDGENQLIGLVDIDDEVNQPLFDTLAAINATLIERRLADPAGPSPSVPGSESTEPTAPGSSASPAPPQQRSPAFTG